MIFQGIASGLLFLGVFWRQVRDKIKSLLGMKDDDDYDDDDAENDEEIVEYHDDDKDDK